MSERKALCDHGRSPRRTLAETVEKVREMHRLYPFTRFESSAGKKARRRRGT